MLTLLSTPVPPFSLPFPHVSVGFTQIQGYQPQGDTYFLRAWKTEKDYIQVNMIHCSFTTANELMKLPCRILSQQPDLRTLFDLFDSTEGYFFLLVPMLVDSAKGSTSSPLC